jgi:hypothetical protein
LNDDINYHIGPEVDNWALGCILIEAAVWVSFGKQGRLNFRELRKQETSSLPDHRKLGRSDCFHDSEGPLGCVKRVHEQVLKNGRRCDTITANVVALVLDHALIPEKERTGARQLLARMKKILHTAQEAIPLSRSSVSQTPSPTNSGSRPLSDIITPFDLRHPTSPPSYGPDRRPFSNQLGLMPTMPFQIGEADAASTLPPMLVQKVPVASPRHSIGSDMPNIPDSSPTMNQVEANQAQNTQISSTVMQSPYPHVTLIELSQWIKDKKDGVNRTLPGWEAAKRELQGRDVVGLDFESSKRFVYGNLRFYR